MKSLPSFNLLPRPRRAQFRMELFNRHLQQSAVLVFLGLMVLVGCLFGGNRLLVRALDRQHAATLEKQQAARVSTDASIDQEIRKFNAALSPVSLLQKNFTKMTPVLVGVLAAFPDGITVSSFTLSSADRSVAASGVAATREDLLALQQALASSPLLSFVSLPVTNLLERENIPFSLTAKLK